MPFLAAHALIVLSLTCAKNIAVSIRMISEGNIGTGVTLSGTLSGLVAIIVIPDTAFLSTVIAGDPLPDELSAVGDKLPSDDAFAGVSTMFKRSIRLTTGSARPGAMETTYRLGFLRRRPAPVPGPLGGCRATRRG